MGSNTMNGQQERRLFFIGMAMTGLAPYIQSGESGRGHGLDDAARLAVDFADRVVEILDAEKGGEV